MMEWGYINGMGAGAAGVYIDMEGVGDGGSYRGSERFSGRMITETRRCAVVGGDTYVGRIAGDGVVAQTGGVYRV